MGKTAEDLMDEPDFIDIDADIDEVAEEVKGSENTLIVRKNGEAVHWHASYQISVCGENRVPRGGPMLAHTHGETQFHLEGVRQNKEQATLDWVLDSLGTKFSENSIYGKTSCNGESANLTVKANGETLESPEDYIIRDGDNIRIKLA